MLGYLGSSGNIGYVEALEKRIAGKRTDAAPGKWDAGNAYTHCATA